MAAMSAPKPAIINFISNKEGKDVVAEDWANADALFLQRYPKKVGLLHATKLSAHAAHAHRRRTPHLWSIPHQWYQLSARTMYVFLRHPRLSSVSHPCRPQNQRTAHASNFGTRPPPHLKRLPGLLPLSPGTANLRSLPSRGRIARSISRRWTFSPTRYAHRACHVAVIAFLTSFQSSALSSTLVEGNSHLLPGTAQEDTTEAANAAELTAVKHETASAPAVPPRLEPSSSERAIPADAGAHTSTRPTPITVIDVHAPPPVPDFTATFLANLDIDMSAYRTSLSTLR